MPVPSGKEGRVDRVAIDPLIANCTSRGTPVSGDAIVCRGAGRERRGRRNVAIAVVTLDPRTMSKGIVSRTSEIMGSADA
jgi:hypothetical protein